MARQEWRFPFSASEVEEAAEVQRDYHQTRVDFWKDEQLKAEGEIKDRGFTIEQHEVTGGHRASVQIAPELLSRLSECQDKIASHQRKVDDYDVWARALERSNEDLLQLEPDDVRFFNL